MKTIYKILPTFMGLLCLIGSFWYESFIITTFVIIVFAAVWSYKTSLAGS